MNFKTTLFLLVLLAAAGAALFLTRDADGPADQKPAADAPGKTLLGVKGADVTTIVVAPKDGPRLVLNKDHGAWKLAEPVAAPAETFEVDALLRAITDAKDNGKAAGDANAASTGLDAPRYVVDVTDVAGRSHRLSVGAKQLVGGNLFVSTGNGQSGAVVTSIDLDAQLAKPASAYRQPKLVNLVPADVKHVTVTRPDGGVTLTRAGDGWTVSGNGAGAATMPAEKTDVDDLLFAVTGMRATEFVADDDAVARAAARLNAPRATVVLSKMAPATQGATQPASTGPATNPGDTVTVTVGSYDTALKENVYVASSDAAGLAKVPPTLLTSVSKNALDLRSKSVVAIDSAAVSRVTITTDRPAATPPGVAPASHGEVTIARRKVTAPVLGPTFTPAPVTQPATTTASTTGPATTQAATQPTTAPAEPPTKWQLVGNPAPSTTMPANDAADDAKIDALLASLSPLRATKFTDPAATHPATQPAATCTLTIATEAAGGAASGTTTVSITDPGNDKPLIGETAGLRFELDRTLAEKLGGDFVKKPGNSTPAPPSFGPPEGGGMPPGMMPMPGGMP